MDCQKYHRDISALVDGELTPDASAALMTHLSACPDCRATLQAVTDLNSHLKEAAPRSDSALASRVKARIGGQHSKYARSPMMPLWGQAPLLALIVLLAIGLGNLAGKSISEILVGQPGETLTELTQPEATRSLADVMMDLSSEESGR